MPPRIRQASFAGGEVHPELHARTDLPRLGHSVALARNWIVTPTGALKNAPGSRLVREVKDSTKTVRLVPFVFNAEQSYVLEVGDAYMRVHRDGGTILDGMDPYEVVAPWAEADLARLDFAQVNDVLYVVHQGYPMYEIQRHDEDDWRIVPYSLTPPINPPTGLALDGAFAWDAADATHPLAEWSWVVTAEDKGGRESLPSAALTVTVAVLYPDKKKPKITWAAPASGNTPERYHVYRGRDGWYGFVGTSETTEFIDESNAPSYGDSPPSGTDPFTHEEGEEAGAAIEVAFSAGVATKATAAEAHGDRYTVHYHLGLGPGEASITYEFQVDETGSAGWTTVKTLSGGIPAGFPPSFEIDRDMVTEITADGMQNGGKFRLNVTASDGTASVTGLKVAWVEAGTPIELPSLPAAVAFFEQRLALGGFSREPSTLKLSQTGNFHSFDTSTPSQDDDRIEMTLAGQRLDEIRHLVQLDALLAFTASSVWRIMGADGGALTHANRDAKIRAEYGSSWLAPIVIGSGVLFVTERARSVRDFTNEQGVTVPRDLSVLASHLLAGRSVVSWCYAAEPWGQVWMVRDDGTLLGMTYLREHDVVAWYRRETAGLYESVCAVPEGTETAVYAVVRREIDGTVARYLERFASREAVDVDGASVDEGCFLDSALSYDGTNTGSGAVKITGGAYAADDAATLQATVGTPFVAADVGKRFHLWSGDDTARVQVTAFGSSSSLTVRVIEDVPASLRDAAVTTWGRAVRVLTGLDHLEGETVGCLADGMVQEQAVVGGGEIEIGSYAVRATVGLPIERADVLTLPLSAPGDPGSFRAARKIIASVGLELGNWRGLWTGRDASSLTEIQRRDTEAGYGPVTPGRFAVEVRPETQWGQEAQVLVRQVDPLPATLLAVLMEVEAGG